jgi:hypothetical protein
MIFLSNKNNQRREHYMKLFAWFKKKCFCRQKPQKDEGEDNGRPYINSYRHVDDNWYRIDLHLPASTQPVSPAPADLPNLLNLPKKQRRHRGGGGTKKHYKGELNRFLKDCCLLDPTGDVPYTTLYNEYLLWARQKNVHDVISRKLFGAAINLYSGRHRLSRYDEKRKKGDKGRSHHGLRHIVGLRLRALQQDFGL